LGTCSIDHSVAVISDVMVYSLMFALVQIYITINEDRSSTNVLQALPKRKLAPSEKD